MNLDVDNLINFFNQSATTKMQELGEDEATTDAGTAGSTSGGAGKAVKKWLSNRTMGKTYMGDPKYKWETGLTRGKANQIANTVWVSGRKMGPTGGSDFA